MLQYVNEFLEKCFTFLQLLGEIEMRLKPISVNGLMNFAITLCCLSKLTPAKLEIIIETTKNNGRNLTRCIVFHKKTALDAVHAKPRIPL